MVIAELTLAHTDKSCLYGMVSTSYYESQVCILLLQLY